MGRFFITGTIIRDIEHKKFKNGSFSKIVFVEEKRDCVKPVVYTHKIEFSGTYAKRIPEDVDLKGALVSITGTLTGKEWGENSCIENCKGEDFILHAIQSFEEESDVIRDTDAEEDLPF